MTAAKLIMTEIRKNKYGTSAYPKIMDIQNTTGNWIFKLLTTFLHVLVRSELTLIRLGSLELFFVEGGGRVNLPSFHISRITYVISTWLYTIVK